MSIAIVAPVVTTCGTISRSETQTGWTVNVARRRIRMRQPNLACLTDEDIVWLLLMGWEP